MLGIALWLILALCWLLAAEGLGALWPRALVRVSTEEGREFLGIRYGQEAVPAPDDAPEARELRTLLRIGNRDLYGEDFVWLPHSRIQTWRFPADAAVVERLEWGPFYGFLSSVITASGTIAAAEEIWPVLQREMAGARVRQRGIRHLERKMIGDINAEMERHRLALKRLELRGALGAPAGVRRAAGHREALEALQARYERVAKDLWTQREDDARHQAVFTSVDGRTKSLPVSSIIRVHRPNRLSWFGTLQVYGDRIAEFIFAEPREANSEGGVAPAIFGTVLMTLLMVVAAVPLGVLTALYLHEYARQGPLVSAVRIAVNNLAGVPSIVFGVFGLGFFCYLIGGTIDQLWFPERLPMPTFGGGAILWASLTLALLTVPVVIVATEEALVAVPQGLREASLACGATKLQTIWRVVLPSALPGILTGAILAMARGAGEVAPLMITGVVKLAPELPVDWTFPFLHLERRFMHLGFHIYDVGFQSPNVEASKAMVYATSLLLVGIVICLNLTSMRIRARLRARFQGARV